MTDKSKNPIADSLIAIADDSAKDTIIVRKIFVEFLGSIEAAIVFNQLLYWTPRSTMGGWIAKSDKDFATELSLTVYSVRKAIAELSKLKVIKTKHSQFNGAPTNCYKIDQDTMAESWQAFLRNRKNDSLKSKERLCEIKESLTETTAETTTHFADSVESAQAQPDNSHSAGDKPKKQLTDRQKITAELEQEFAEVSGIPLPLRETKKQCTAAAELWWNPLLEINTRLANGDIAKSKSIIRQAVVELREWKAESVSSPKSILAKATAIASRIQANGSQSVLVVR